nr:uncharacterized protein LOC128695524 [Cherax quadricarinatus]
MSDKNSGSIVASSTTTVGASNTTEGGEVAATGEHWAIFGDSHMRYLFTAFLTRLRSPTLQYRLKTDTKKWVSIAPLEKKMYRNKIWEKIEARDLSINFHMTFYWDIWLMELPKMLSKWEKNPQLTPTLVILAAALHWMVRTQSIYQSQGTEAAANEYRKHFRSMKAQLTRLAARTTVVFKLFDDVRIANRPNKQISANNRSNYGLYNKVVVEELAGTGVIIWDSTLPLSRAYSLYCDIYPRHTPPWYQWKCEDVGHVGYILVDQYADMIFNDYCNRYLKLGKDYCA